MSTMMTPTLCPELEPQPPVVHGSLAVYPIRARERGEPDDYLLLEDALEMELVRITEVTEGGSVPLLLLENTAKLPVLGVQGEELRGAKQNRTLNLTLLAAPGKIEIPVTCVERGRWGYSSREFSSGDFEFADLRRAKMESVTARRASSKGASIRKPEKFFADQQQVWGRVSSLLGAFQVGSPTEAMADVYDSGQLRDSLNDRIGGIDVPEDTRGVVVAIGGRIASGEVFEAPSVFRRMWPRLKKSYALSSLAVRDASPPPAEAAQRFVNRPGREAGEAEESVGLGEDVRWKEKDFVAAALSWEGRLLHGVVFPRGEPRRRPRAGAWPSR